jgi:TatA/E family protein of Tat protein translocase
MLGFDWIELLLILIIVMVVLGAEKLPQLEEGIGKAIKGFTRSINESEIVAAQPMLARDNGEAASPTILLSTGT